MFDAHIQYYAYDNTEEDDFGVGYLGNKEFWVHLINSWSRNANITKRWKVEQWDDIDQDFFSGCILAEIEPDGKDYIVTWVDKTKDYVVRISGNSLTWEPSSTKLASIPRWINRLKNQLKEQS